MKKFAVMATVALSMIACTPPAFPSLDTVEQRVLADLEAGMSAEQIEVDIGSLVAGKTGADIVKTVQDAIDLLLDLGLVPTKYLDAATTLHNTEHLKLTTGDAR